MSSIQAAKLGMGYQTATQRPSCKNCKHSDEQLVDRMPPYDKAGWRCTKGGFITWAMAICNQHESKRQQGGAT